VTIDEFWEIVPRTVDARDQADALQSELAKHEPEQILQFAEHLERIVASGYLWDLWAAAYIMKGGASDDGFLYFRGWLVGRGRDAFEAALADPESLADRFEPGDAWNFEDESLLYAPRDAFERATGDDRAFDDDPRTAPRDAPEPGGQSWEDDELESRFPRLTRPLW